MKKSAEIKEENEKYIAREKAQREAAGTDTKKEWSQKNWV